MKQVPLFCLYLDNYIHPNCAIFSEAQIREHICEDITGSGLLKWWRLKFLSQEEIRGNQDRSEYLEIFDLIYSPSITSYEYTNEYRRHKFQLMGSSKDYFTEYVFVCPLKSCLIWWGNLMTGTIILAIMVIALKTIQ